MKTMVAAILAILLLVPVVLFLWGPRRENARAAEDAARLRSRQIDLSGRTYREAQISALPAPVQRYFRNVLKDGQPYVSAVTLTHDGQFKTGLDKEWIDIEGQQLFIADEPGFLWRGKTSLFSVRDMYVAGEGRIVVSLFSLFDVVDGRGEAYDQGELLRWLRILPLPPDGMPFCPRILPRRRSPRNEIKLAETRKADWMRRNG